MSRARVVECVLAAVFFLSLPCISAAGELDPKFDSSTPLGDDLSQRFGGASGYQPLTPAPSAILDTKSTTVDEQDDAMAQWHKFTPAPLPTQEGAVLYIAPPKGAPQPAGAAAPLAVVGNAPKHGGWHWTLGGIGLALSIAGGVTWRIVRVRRQPPVIAVPVPLDPSSRR